jgi:YXWGXW repeat-containing protein
MAMYERKLYEAETLGFQYLRLLCQILLTLSMILLASKADPQVRAPRDTPAMVRGRAQPLTGVDSSPYPTVQRPHAEFALKQAPAAPLGIDPGYRPLWVPGTYVWNGIDWNWAPGHWVWEPRPSF